MDGICGRLGKASKLEGLAMRWRKKRSIAVKGDKSKVQDGAYLLFYINLMEQLEDDVPAGN